MTDADNGVMPENRDGCKPSFTDIPWGPFDAAYSTKIWWSRVENLESHLRIIRDYLPEDRDWLRGQVDFAISEARKYLRDWQDTGE